MNSTSYDAVVVGSGPNGLTAAAVLGMAGLSVVLLEGAPTIGGGCRTEPLTLPGFFHDVCSAIHPMGTVSPIFRALKLTDHGLQWVTASSPLAHPFDNQPPAVLSRDIGRTANELGVDGRIWRRMMQPFVDRQEDFFPEILKPVRVPLHPVLMARFGALALRSCDALARSFAEPRAKALLAGNAAHSSLPLDAAASASFGLVLAVAGHAADWPCARGGSIRIAEALASIARGVGCEIETGTTVRSIRDLPPARAVLFDVTPRQLDAIAGDTLSTSYRRQLQQFRYGAGSFKIDYALSQPIPWRACELQNAMTVHVGGTLEEIARSESEHAAGRVSEQPFVLVAQQSQFDSSRSPAGQHTGWAYCHVPNGCTIDMTERIERQIERFAPGFRDVILARHVTPPAALEAHNPNLVGGDIGGGHNGIAQFLTRPFVRWNPYTTSNPKLFLCSSSTPPGGGVHGMCGYWSARTVLERAFRRPLPPALAL